MSSPAMSSPAMSSPAPSSPKAPGPDKPGSKTPDSRTPDPASRSDKPDPSPDLSGLPFEKALAELEDIVRQLEGGRVPLEDSIAIYERGEALKRHCDGLLKKAETRIDRIAVGADGRPTGTVPLDPPA